MTFSFLPAAEADAAAAQDYYVEHAGSAVARRFVDELERVATLLDANPGLGTPWGRARRIYPLRSFPYLVIYAQTPGGIRIVIVRHQHRKPIVAGDFA